MKPFSTRTDFNKAQGLGSARTGVAHWWMQRATAVALIPLTLWFATALVEAARGGHDAFTVWLASPIVAILMILLLLALFYHMALGLQVVIEDYVHSAKLKLPLLLAVKQGCLVLAVVGILSVLRIAFGAEQ